MRSLVITTGSPSTITNPKNHHHHHHHHNYHLFTPKNHHHFHSLHNLISLSLSKPTSPSPPSSSSTPSPPTSALPLPPNSHPHHLSNQLSYYADIASELVEAGRFEEFKLIVESVISSEVSESSGFGNLLNSKLLVGGIVKGLKEGRIKDVVGLFGCFPQLGVDVLGVFDGFDMELLKNECFRIVNQGFLEDAVDLIEVLAGAILVLACETRLGLSTDFLNNSGFQFSIKDLVKPNDLIRMCVSRRKPVLAVRYACLLPHAEVVFCTIIREFGKRADLLSAVKVFEAAKQKLTGHNMYVYRTMIDVCGLCGNCFKSRLIYEDLLNQKVTPNIFVFNSLMNVNSHDLTYTMGVYKQMQDFGIQADMTSYNILLKACCLSERVDLAQDIYMEVQHLESTGALKLDVFTYCTIIKVFADAKLWQMAIKIKEDMLSAGVTPNTVTWSSLISACANAGLVDQATQLFEEMLMAGCEPNSQCFNTILHACVEACQYDRAFRLFNTWKSSGSSEKSTDNSSAAITSSIQPTEKDRSTIPFQSATATRHLSFAKSIPFKPTIATYNILLKACGTNIYQAKGLMDEMKEANLSPNQISWSILIDMCGATGDVQGALQILKTMGDTGIKPDVVAYTTAIKVCVESKNLKMAFSLFAEMKRYRIKPNLVTYNTLLRARSRYGSVQEVQQCLAIYQDMRRAGFKSYDNYLKLLIEEWCEGVIQKNSEEREHKLHERADIGRLRSLLLDRVATHLQKNTAESLAVDIQGLTKVEARLVVLAVLRMIKENYMSGRPVQDDLIVILGIPKLGAGSIVKDAITKLLTKELGLEVLPANPGVTIVQKLENSTDQDSEGVIKKSELAPSLEASARRPAVLQRLLVTKKSLNYWLRRKLNAASRS